MIVSLVPDDAVDMIWGRISHFIKKATDTSKGKFYKDDVLKGIKDKNLKLWVVVDESLGIDQAHNKDFFVGSLTTRCIQYTDYKVLAIDWVGGKKMKEWKDVVLNDLESYAKDQGCKVMEGYGRSAWGRVLSNRSWKMDHIVYRMELSS
jgi:hypothetical protein|tara:strand:- start:14903 stop:15349 length:447 start_codon:yes stop_codon:yes gene_type:complete